MEAQTMPTIGTIVVSLWITSIIFITVKCFTAPESNDE